MVEVDTDRSVLAVEVARMESPGLPEAQAARYSTASRMPVGVRIEH